MTMALPMAMADPIHALLGRGTPETREAIERLGDVLPNGLLVTDRRGRITYWNSSAEWITGYARSEVIGRTCEVIACGDREAECPCERGPSGCSACEHVKSVHRCRIRVRDGRQVQIIKHAVPLLSPEGELVGAIKNFTDVSEPAAPGLRETSRLVGEHSVMKELGRLIALVASSDATVMILGESGTGKELVAEAIHRSSQRADKPFVCVSCSALNENLLESELFGHVKGAFTGALRDRRGRFQEADGGTLLLDEIGDISPAVQVKLLRVVQQRQIERVGDSVPIKVDVRLLCATHRDLKALVAEGKFRADLYFRLNVFPLRVPPLRERSSDIPLLCGALLERLRPGRENDITADALARLCAYPWPGNVRELQNAIEYAALRAGDLAIQAEHLPVDLLSPLPAAAAAGSNGDAERRAELSAALEKAGWNRAQAAQTLGISRVTLWKRMKRLGLLSPDS
jgi:two-component system response regulator HydG